MIIGQTIAAEEGNDTKVYTPWFPRQGKEVTSVVELLAISGDGKLDVSIQTKDSDDAADPTTGIGGLTNLDDTDIGANAFQLNTNEACSELVRYEIRLHTSVTDAVVFAHFRMLSPSWQATGAQGV